MVVDHCLQSCRSLKSCSGCSCYLSRLTISTREPLPISASLSSRYTSTLPSPDSEFPAIENIGFLNPDTDNDGLVDGDEVNTYSTNPNSPDSDSDGFTDLYELETAYDPNSAESVPDALVNIMTAIEVKFNAALGATYAIEFSTDNQNWDVIEDDIVGEGGAVELSLIHI